ncbi:MAG: response regulator [Pseudomonadota bacterium]|nr:response regulator [Pseudomonadota bacterium]MEA3240121.1 response regulator [Pseudomonadota bacterium]
MTEKKAILFVDDEMSILRSLKRAFLDSGYQLYFADSGAKGLAALKAKDIDLVVSDMRMPQMDGYQFLSQVKKEYPQVVRLILSGFTQEETVYKALIDGSAKMYVAKPWDNQKLKALIRQLLEIQETLQQQRLLEVVNTIDQLPTLPTIYHKIMDLIEQNTDFDKIVAVVEKDPAITAKVLQVANSAYFRSSTASLKRAAVFIGLMNLKDIVLGCSVLEALGCRGLGKFSVESLWEHFVRSNGLVHNLYERIHDEKVDETCGSAGLLYDVGLLVLLRYFPEKFKEILARCRQHADLSLVAAEEAVMGVNHAQLGAYVLSWWNLPQPIIEATLYHHNPLSESVANRDFVSLVGVVSQLSLGLLDAHLVGELDPRVIEAAGMSPAMYEDVQQRLLP